MSSTVLPETTLALLDLPLADSIVAGAVVLADPATTAEAGCRWPVYLTRSAWERHVAVTDAAASMLCDERGRLWDVMWMFTRAARRFDGAMLRVVFYGVVDEPRVHRCTLYAVIAVQDDKPHVLLVTATEALGEPGGAVTDARDRILDGDSDEEDDV